MDQAEADEGGLVRATGSMNAVQDPGRKQTSFMEKLMGVKNSQCDLYLEKVHRELDQAKIRQMRNLQGDAVRVQYDLKLMQVNIKRQEILEKKKANPRSDTSLDEAMIDKSAKYLQCNNVNPCYLDRSMGVPLRRSINSDYRSPTVNKARKALQDHQVERQVEKMQDDRKSQVSRKSMQSRRSVHFQVETPNIQVFDLDDDSDDKTGNKSTKSSSSESKSGASIGSRTPVIKKPRATFSAKATVLGSPRPNSQATRTVSRGRDGYKILLTNEREKTSYPSKPSPRSMTSLKVMDSTDVNVWAEQSARFQQNAKNQNMFPDISNAKNNQDSLNNNQDTDSVANSSYNGNRKLDILDSPEDRNEFMNLITSWKGPSKSNRSQSNAPSRATTAVSRRQGSAKSTISYTQLRSQQAQMHWKLQNFYYRLKDDKAKAVKSAQAKARQREMTMTGFEDGMSVVSPTPVVRSIDRVARARWQRAIRKVLDNLDDMLEHAYDDVPSLALTPFKAAAQDDKTAAEVKYLGQGGKQAKGQGGPSNSLNRSKRHTATFKLQQVVKELLKNKSTFQKLEYEETKLKLMGEKEEGST